MHPVRQFRYRLNQSRRVVADEGLTGLREAARVFLGQRLLRISPDLTQHRFLLGDRLARQLSDTVRYGPFAGLRLMEGSWWSGADRGGMLLGFYESEVLSELASLSSRYSTFVDIGAADGYYAVGMVRSGFCKFSICFETSPGGQQAIRELADANHVGDSVQVLGHADGDFVQSLKSLGFSQHEGALFLMDIEGGEYDLLTQDVLSVLANSCVIVELHSQDDGSNTNNRSLVGRAKEFFECSIISQGSRNPNTFPELASWDDDDRWLLCSESRPYLMSWLVLRPRED